MSQEWIVQEKNAQLKRNQTDGYDWIMQNKLYMPLFYEVLGNTFKILYGSNSQL